MKQLLACVPYLNKRVAFCLPHAYLERFYTKAGFLSIDHQSLPPILNDRFNNCLDKGLKVLAMRRLVPNNLLETF